MVKETNVKEMLAKFCNQKFTEIYENHGRCSKNG